MAIDPADGRCAHHAVDSVIVANDCDPRSSHRHSLRTGQASYPLGQIEGCRFAEPHRYQLVDRIGWGPSPHFTTGRRCRVAGHRGCLANSPKFERHRWQCQLQVTYGLTAGQKPGSPRLACQKVGLRADQPPSRRPPGCLPPLADEDFRDLILARLLITAPARLCTNPGRGSRWCCSHGGE